MNIEKYANVIITIILLLICAIIYYRYTRKEAFQNEMPANNVEANDLSANKMDIGTSATVDASTIRMIEIPEIKPTINAGVTGLAAVEKDLHDAIAPIIEANPELKGGFSTDKGPAIANINIDKVKEQIMNSPLPTTAVDRRSLLDVNRQCDAAQTQLAVLSNIVNEYKKSNSWAQVKGVTKSIITIQQHMSDLGC